MNILRDTGKLLILVTILMGGCSSQETTVNPQPDPLAELHKSFSEFQTFTDKTFPGWSVIAIRKDETTMGDDGTERYHYYAILRKGDEERVVFLIQADFRENDGETVNRIYLPVILPQNHPEEAPPFH